MPTVALFGCAVAILAWGGAALFDKIAVRGVDPFGAVLVRMAFVTVALLAFCAATGRLRQVAAFPPTVFLCLAASGLLGGFLGQAAYYLAIKQAPASQIVPVTATYPVVAVLLAVLFLHERLTPLKAFGVVLVVAGLMLVAGAGARAKPEPVGITAPQPSPAPPSHPPADRQAEDRASGR